MFCNQCGNQMPDTAKFCPKCGAQVKTVKKEPEPVVDSESTMMPDPPPVTEPAPAPVLEEPALKDGPAPVEALKKEQPAAEVKQEPVPDKPGDDASKRNHVLWILYITFGVAAYALVELATTYAYTGPGFGIFLGVIAIMVSIAFLAIGIIKKIMGMKEPEEDKKKHSLVNTVTMIISIIMYVYVLLMAIAAFSKAAELIASGTPVA